jgi:uncharacterized protein YaiL (DUF2058 family)
MNSLKDQLLKAGLVKPKQLKNQAKKKPPTKAKSARNKPSEQALRTQRAMLDKARKDKKLNEQRQREAAKRELAAQIKQLVDGSKLDRKEGEISYSFNVGKKIKSIYVTNEQQQQLSRGQISIVSLGDQRFDLVPKAVAQKIFERDATSLIQNHLSTAEKPTEDDIYADYQIPDDLSW